MLLKLLSELDIKQVSIAGADGYTLNGQNYYNTSMRNYKEHDSNFNINVAKAMRKLGINIDFLTPSKYEYKGE